MRHIGQDAPTAFLALPLKWQSSLCAGGLAAWEFMGEMSRPFSSSKSFFFILQDFCKTSFFLIAAALRLSNDCGCLWSFRPCC